MLRNSHGAGAVQQIPKTTAKAKGYLLEVAFYTNRENTDVRAVGSGLLDEAGIDDFLVFVETARAIVANLKSAD